MFEGGRNPCTLLFPGKQKTRKKAPPFMKITPRQRLMEFAHLLQDTLFGAIAESVGQLSEKAQLLVAVMTTVSIQAYLPSKGRWNGRPAKDRQALATAFVAKAVYGFSSTRYWIACEVIGNCCAYAAGTAHANCRTNPLFRELSRNSLGRNCRSDCTKR
jgi:hypothetical protein